jgi:hypothetical protein
VVVSGIPFVRGSDTSKAAAASIEGHVKTLESQVFDLVRQAGDRGLTDDELEVLTALSHQTVSARRRTLVLKRMLRDGGQRRRTRSNRLATVWILGEDMRAVEGVLHKAPPRPSEEELAAAVGEIRLLVRSAKANGYEPSDALQKLGRWLRHLSKPAV